MRTGKFGRTLNGPFSPRKPFEPINVLGYRPVNSLKAKVNTMPDEKNPQMSKTLKSLKLTRNPLSKTLVNMKVRQEALQSSVKSANQATATGKFRLNQLQQFGKGSLAYS